MKKSDIQFACELNEGSESLPIPYFLPIQQGHDEPRQGSESHLTQGLEALGLDLFIVNYFNLGYFPFS